MSVNVETPNISAEVINAAFVHKLESGLVKEAMLAGSTYIRQKLYEEGVLRRLFEPWTVTADELDPEEGNDKPSILREIEPDTPAATFVPLKGTGDRRYFYGNRYRVPFGKIEANRESKSKFELMTMRMDIMSWLKDRHVKVIQEQEDLHFMTTVETVITGTSNTAAAGSSQDYKAQFVEGLQAMAALNLPVGKVLMNKQDFLATLNLKVESIGYKAQDRRFEEGVEGEDTFLGYPVVTTLNTTICPVGSVYFFAPREYFCDFMLLQDATLFLKQEADMIEFFTYEAPGIGIGNVNGVFKLTAFDGA